MALEAGTKIGPYEILSPLGAGGMGEVYRAHDTKLGRDVAVKVLPEEFASDPERLARFDREAKLLASLNHPNIASIHGFEDADGVNALVLELVEGPTLAERIAQGPIPVDEALSIAKQIAEALEAGHEAGVIHRDLKPSNIKLKEDGTVKVLDYGLAKAFEGESPGSADSELSQSPTLTRHGTQVGVILGTAAYMSPEQARGKRVDKRTDIWAFGCCLYESLTGKKAFAGETVTDTLAAIVKNEPDWQALPKDVPTLAEVLRRCLTKDPMLRLRDIGEARIRLQDGTSGAFSYPSAPSVAMDRASSGGLRMALVAGGALALGALVTFLLTVGSGPPSPLPNQARLSVNLPDGVTLPILEHRTVAVSPDGRSIAYVAEHEGERRLYLRTLDDLATKALPGTEGGSNPFFSPDGEWLGFFDRPNRKLKKVLVGGDAPTVTVCDTGASGRGAAWGNNGIIVFQNHFGSGLHKVPSSGDSPPEVLTIPDEKKSEKNHRFPQILPDGNTVLFTTGFSDISSYDDAKIAIVSMDTNEQRVLIDGGSEPRYVPTGHIVYARAGSLMAVPFDVKTLQVTGTPVRVLDGVVTSGVWGVAQFSVSREGTLVYVPGSPEDFFPRLLWVDRDGASRPVPVERAMLVSVRVSPEGRRLALTIGGANDDVWIYELERGTLTRLTNGWDNLSPIWMPDGNGVVFSSNRNVAEGFGLFQMPTDGGRDVASLVFKNDLFVGGSVSADGESLVYATHSAATSDDIWMISLDQGNDPRPVLASSFSERSPSLSPDGRWLAYVSDETGREEIFVAPFPEPDAKWRISNQGGTMPAWSTDGRELFYREGNAMVAVTISHESRFVAGKPRVLFRGEFMRELPYGRNYDVSPDGHFAVIEPSQKSYTELHVFVNWFEELKRLAPTQ